MLDFRPLQLEDLPRLRPYFAYSGSRLCDTTPGTVFIWRDMYRTEYALWDNSLYFKVDYPGVGPTFTLPLGGGRLEQFRQIAEYCLQNKLLDMIDDMAKRYPGVETDKFFLFGHSGGGQFVNRFLFAHPEKLRACAIGAPGRPTFLNPDEDYFWGTRDFKNYFGHDVDLAAVQKVPVLVIVGENDTKFIGDSPYGDNRVARMKSLQKNLQDHGVHTELTILPGFAHEGGEKERVQAAQHFFEAYL